MNIKDFGWERLPAKYESGDYWFNGKFAVTVGVTASVPQEEILLIWADIQNLVGQHGGQDYLQVYVQKETKQKLFLIDNVSRQSLKTEEVSPEDHYCTLLLPSEY